MTRIDLMLQIFDFQRMKSATSEHEPDCDCVDKHASAEDVSLARSVISNSRAMSLIVTTLAHLMILDEESQDEFLKTVRIFSIIESSGIGMSKKEKTKEQTIKEIMEMLLNPSAKGNGPFFVPGSDGH